MPYDGGREIRAQYTAGLVDDGLQLVANAAEQQRLARDLGRPVEALDVIRDDRVGVLGELGGDLAAHLLPVSLGRDIADLGFGGNHRADAHAGDQLLGRLFLERPDLLGALGGLSVASLEEVDLRQHRQEIAMGGLVGDLVAVEHGQVVAAHLGGKATEGLLVLDEIFQLSVDLVGKARHVRRLFDARLRLRESRGRQAAGQQDEQDSLEHGEVPLAMCGCAGTDPPPEGGDYSGCLRCSITTST